MNMYFTLNKKSRYHNKLMITAFKIYFYVFCLCL